MDGVSRIVYMPEFNQLDLIDAEFRKLSKRITPEQVYSRINHDLKRVESEDGTDASLVAFLSNHKGRKHFYRRIHGISLIVFPKSGKVDHFLKRSADLFVNYSVNPVRVIHSTNPGTSEITLEQVNSYLLFRTNPFLADTDNYLGIGDIFSSNREFKEAVAAWRNC